MTERSHLYGQIILVDVNCYVMLIQLMLKLLLEFLQLQIYICFQIFLLTYRDPRMNGISTLYFDLSEGYLFFSSLRQMFFSSSTKLFCNHYLQLLYSYISVHICISYIHMKTIWILYWTSVIVKSHSNQIQNFIFANWITSPWLIPMPLYFSLRIFQASDFFEDLNLWWNELL